VARAAGVVVGHLRIAVLGLGLSGTEGGTEHGEQGKCGRVQEKEAHGEPPFFGKYNIQTFEKY
jgi:hypothetical protein